MVTLDGKLYEKSSAITGGYVKKSIFGFGQNDDKELENAKAKQIGREKDRDFASLEELFSYVKQQHEAYLKKRSNVEKDIEHIVVINRQLVDAIAQLFHNHKSHHKMA